MTESAAEPRFEAMLFGIPRADVAIGCAIAFGAAALTFVAHGRIAPEILDLSLFDFWFESDPPAVLNQLLSQWTMDHYRTARHPLFSLVATLPMLALERASGLARFALERPEVMVGHRHWLSAVFVSGSAALWAAAVWVTVRAFGHGRLASLAWTALLASSGAAVFFLPLLETFALGTVSLILPIAMVAAHERGVQFPLWSQIAVCVFSFAITTTHGLAGLLMLLVLNGPVRGALVGAVTGAVVIALSALQKLIFPWADFVLAMSTMEEEGAYLFHELALGPLQRSIAFFLHGQITPVPIIGKADYLTVQPIGPFTGGPLHDVSALLWLALLALAAVGMVRSRRRTTGVLVVMLAAYFAFVQAFGQETFLYSLIFTPLLVLLCVDGASRVAPRAAVGLAIACALMGGLNNVRSFASGARETRVRYQQQRDFVAAVLRNVEQGELMVLGLPPAMAEGHRSKQLDPGVPPERISRLYPADGSDFAHHGWVMPYESWSLEALQTWSDAGAVLFATSYRYGIGYGIEEPHPLIEALRAQGASIDRGDGFELFDLRALRPGNAIGGGGRPGGRFSLRLSSRKGGVGSKKKPASLPVGRPDGLVLPRPGGGARGPVAGLDGP